MGITKDDIKLKAGILGAEPWTEEMRQEIQDKLGIKLMISMAYLKLLVLVYLLNVQSRQECI